MKTFKNFMEASTCLHTKEGEKCPVHGTKECPEVIETPRKKSKNYLLNNKTIGEAKEKDHEYSMARSELKTVTNAAKRLQKKMGKKGEGNLQAWVQSKITKAADYIDTAADYVTNEETKSGDSSLRDWFTKSRSSDGTPGWVQLEGRAKNVATEAVDATKYGGPDKLLQRLVPKGEKVIPSTPKKTANVKESYLRIQERGKTYSIILNWRGKSITTQMFFPKFGRPSKSEVLGEIVKVYPGAKVLYYNPVMRDPTQPLLFAGTQNEPR